MREFKFRGKTYRGEWIIGSLKDDRGHTSIGRRAFYFSIPAEIADVPRKEDSYWTSDYVNSVTVGQFTGVRDVQGHEIYEGDIVDVDYILYDPWDDAEESLEPMRCVVVYEDFGFRFKKEEDLSYFLHDVKNIKVIGNIHDNPDLLKGGAQ